MEEAWRRGGCGCGGRGGCGCGGRVAVDRVVVDVVVVDGEVVDVLEVVVIEMVVEGGGGGGENIEMEGSGGKMHQWRQFNFYNSSQPFQFSSSFVSQSNSFLLAHPTHLSVFHSPSPLPSFIPPTFL